MRPERRHSGTLRGKLTSKDTVSVESGAVVEADISASSLSVGGQITVT